MKHKRKEKKQGNEQPETPSPWPTIHSCTSHLRLAFVVILSASFEREEPVLSLPKESRNPQPAIAARTFQPQNSGRVIAFPQRIRFAVFVVIP